MKQTLEARIGPDKPPFIVAEMSGNHNHSLERALQIAEAAAKAKVDALKLQTYTADTMTLDIASGEFLITDVKNPWHGRTMHQLYAQAHTPWEWHEAIFKRCRELGIFCFSTPFDATAVDFLESLGNPLYKISSLENTDLPLIRKAAATGKPLLISTGMATEAELAETVQAARGAGCKKLVLMKCTTSYPAEPGDANLLTIPQFRERFGVDAGVSDHTMGIGVTVGAVALGACVVEKHFTLDRRDGGVDSLFSMEPAEMEQLVVEANRAWKARGFVHYGPTENEKRYLVHRRSLYVSKDVAQGEVFTAANVRAVRPGSGLPPKHYEEILGRKAAKPVKKGTPLSWDLVN